MFSFIKKVVTTVVPWGSDIQENNLDEEERVIVNNIRNLTTTFEENSGEPENVTNPEEILGQSDSVQYNVETFKCVHKSGTVTQLNDEFGLIDSVVYFEPNQVSAGLVLKVDDEVLYSAYKAKENEAERVYKVYALKNDAWDPGSNLETGPQRVGLQEAEEIPAINRSITGRVTQRRGREVYIESADIWCDLDKIKATYIPVEGDWVELNASVSLNEESVDLTGDILVVNSLKPLLTKSGFGRISLWSEVKKEGAIENFIYFTSVACEDGSLSLGDEVAYEAIESDQERFKWRAVKVKLVKLRTMDRGMNSIESEDFLSNTLGVDDKHGIVILPVVCSVEIELNQSKTVTLEIVNNGAAKQFLKKAEFLSMKDPQLKLLTTENTKCTYISPKQSIVYQFECEGKHLGLTAEVFHFVFEEFTITRRFDINVVGNQEMNKFLECKFDTVFTVKKKDIVKSEVDVDIILYGPKPWKPPRFCARERKCVFKIPDKLWCLLKEPTKSMEKSLINYAPYLKSDLNFNTYGNRFHTLLFLEEIDIRISFRKFDMNGVFFQHLDEYLVLQVPGLVEKRPSLILGDKVSVIQPWSKGCTAKHIGYVHDIREKEIFVKFHASFHDAYDGSECDVTFEPCTNFFPRCHEAVNRSLKVLGQQWLFPTSVNEKPAQISFDVEEKMLPETVADFFNKIPKNQLEKNKSVPPSCDVSKIESSLKGETDDSPKKKKKKKKKKLVWASTSLNDRQKLAVVNILKGLGRPLPYIIFGPPGTGKTVTLVETIIQIYRMVPDSRILIATPSNSSADLICERLIDIGNFTPGQLVRVLAIYRVMNGLVPKKIIPYSTFCFLNGLETDSLEKRAQNNKLKIKGSSLKELVGSHRITIATCVTIGAFHYSGLSSGHFSHIFVDEAGQTSEPEILIATSFQNIKSGQVVLAGDPQQLGPVIQSTAAKKYGLGVSLLQRLIGTFPYCRDLKGFPETSGYDPRFITKLNFNYRSIPEILTLPNQMFYNSDLIPTVSQTEGEEADIINKFNFKLENRETPCCMVFHGVVGQNFQENDSPSWYNPHEIWQIVFHIKKLYSIGLDCDKIGIVTPYSKQVQKLKQLLTALQLAVPKVGSVEEFQGQERFVIILSTVRSNPKYVPSDITHSLGFVASPQRLNVALTRARALLIIIGNPFLLSEDPYWVNVVKYCKKNNSYTGCDLDSNEKFKDIASDNESSQEKKVENANAPN